MESPSMLAPTITVVGTSPSVPLLHRYYILLKAHYFLFFSAFGMLYPILSITLRSRGLSNTEISLINLIIPFLVFFTNPLTGFTADHSRRYLLVFNLILALVIISYGVMFLLPSIKSHHIQAKILHDEQFNGRILDFCANQEVATKCSSRSQCGCSYESYCKNENLFFNFTFTMNSNHTRRKLNTPSDISKAEPCGIEYQVPIDDYIKNISLINENSVPLATCEIICSIPYYCSGLRYPRQILPILLYSILFILGTNFLSNAISIGASIGFATLPRPDIFGQQRVWGTIGFGISAFTASRLYEIFGTEFVYIIMFSITTTICIIVTSFIRIQPEKKKRSVTSDNIVIHEEEMNDLSMKMTTKEKKKKDISQLKIAALIPLLKKIDVIVFLSLTFIWGMSYAALDPYVYLYVDETAPCQSRSVIGWMSLTDAISEIVAVYVAGRLIKMLGTNLSSVLIFVAFSIRFSGYYLIRKPYYFVFVETMHFFNFGILYVLIAQKADSIAPPGLSGTLQGVVYGISFGLGRGVGLIASSLIYTRFYPRLLFLSFALFNAIAAIAYGLYFFLYTKYSKKTIRTNHNTNVPKIVIDSEPTINEEPLLISSSSNTADNRINEQ
jgi:MFS family permease